MKIIYFTIVLLLTISTAIAQGGGAYGQLKPLDNSLSKSLQASSRRQAQANAANRIARERQRKFNQPIFNNRRDLALTAFKNENYTKCIEHYHATEKLGFHDSSLELAAGVSYYHLFTQTNNLKYKRRAKKILRLSKKHGSIEAELFLNSNLK